MDLVCEYIEKNTQINNLSDNNFIFFLNEIKSTKSIILKDDIFFIIESKFNNLTKEKIFKFIKSNKIHSKNPLYGAEDNEMSDNDIDINEKCEKKLLSYKGSDLEEFLEEVNDEIIYQEQIDEFFKYPFNHSRWQKIINLGYASVDKKKKHNNSKFTNL